MHARHRRRLDGEGDQVFGLETAEVALAARAGDGLSFQRQHREIVGEPTPGGDGIEPGSKRRVLRGDAGGIAALLPS